MIVPDAAPPQPVARAGESIPPADTGLTDMLPEAEVCPDVPLVVTDYLNIPATVVVPLMVATPKLKLPVTPVGNPEKVAPMPPPPIV